MHFQGLFMPLRGSTTKREGGAKHPISTISSKMLHSYKAEPEIIK